MKNGANVRRGREAQQAGDNFEMWVAQHLASAVELGILAHYLHNEPKAKYIRGKLTYVERSGADYIGVLEGVETGGEAHVRLMSARYLAIECKSIKGESLPRSMIEKDQAEHLEAVARAGGLALFVGEFRTEHGCVRFACPWFDVPWQVARTAASVTPQAMEPWIVWSDFCFLKRWHDGGSRNGLWSPIKNKYYPTE